jgi:O-antigen ligase
MSTVEASVESSGAAMSATTRHHARLVRSVTSLRIARAGLVLSVLATPLPSGTIMNVGLAIAVAGAVGHVWSTKRLRLPAPVWLMVLFTAATAVSTALAIDPWCGFAGAGDLMGAIAGRAEIPLWCGFRGLVDIARSTLVLVLAMTLLESDRLRRTWLVAIVTVTCFVALSGFFEYAMGQRTGGKFLRDAAIGHSNQTASYLVMALPASVCVLIFGVFSGGARLLAGVTVALGAVAVVLTQSLAAWLAAAVVGVVIAMRFASRRGWLVASAFVVVIGLSFLLVGPRWEKFTTAWFAMSTGWRLSWWAGALRVIAEHSLFGVGPRNFILIDGPTYGFRSTFHAHNLYLNVATEHGLVGLTLLVATVAAIAARLKATYATIADSFDRACWWAAACAVLAFALLGLATTPYHSRHAIMLWAIVGLFLAQFRDRPGPVRPA